MQNTPFDVDTLRPYDYLLMGRLQAAELMLVKLANLVGEAVPSIKQAVAQLTAEAGNGHKVGEENAAALYLHQVIDPIKVPEGKELTLAEIYAESESSVKYVNELLALYLPQSGVANPVGNLPHPLALPADAYLSAWKKPVDLKTHAVHEILDAVLGQKTLTPFLTAAFHPSGQTLEPVFILPNQGPHAVVISLHRNTWTIVTFPAGLNAMFEHRQARVLNLTKLKAQVREILTTAQSPRVKSMQRPVDENDTKIQVLLGEIFGYEQGGSLDHQTDYYRFKVTAGMYAAHNEAVSLFALDVRTGSPITMEAMILKSNPKVVLSVLGERALQVEIKALPAASKAMLVETLAALERYLKQKKKDGEPKRIARKKKAVVKKTTKVVKKAK